jgi:hypothetical protein
MYRANVYESGKLIDNIYILGIKNYELERKEKILYYN